MYSQFFEQHIDKFRIGYGDQAYGLCPFHTDTNPSWSCNVESGLWICHACGEKGNAWQLAERLGVDPPDIEADEDTPLQEVALNSLNRVNSQQLTNTWHDLKRGE